MIRWLLLLLPVCAFADTIVVNPGDSLINARDQARATAGDDTILLNPGVYVLPETLTLTAQDSGTIWKSADPNNMARVRGGDVVTGWQSGAQYEATVDFPIRHLWGAQRAREPDEGFYRLTAWGDERLEIPADTWTAAKELVVLRSWDMDVLPIQDTETLNNSVLVTPKEPPRSLSFGHQFPWKLNDAPFYLSGGRALIDVAGEWAQVGQTVYHKSQPDDLIAAHLTTLVEINGASDIRLVNLVFEYTDWTRPSLWGYVGRQSSQYRVSGGAVYVPGAIRLLHTRGVVIDKSVVQHVGNTAIELVTDTEETIINGTVIRDVAASGIAVRTRNNNETAYDGGPVSVNDLISNNLIYDVGTMYHGSAGIVAGYVKAINIRHNEIRDVPYTGISVGFGWETPNNVMQNNAVEKNVVTRAMTLMEDGAGIYMNGSQPGSHVSGNVIKDIQPSQWARDIDRVAVGVYLDYGTSGITVKDNYIDNAHTDRKDNGSNSWGKPPGVGQAYQFIFER